MATALEKIREQRNFMQTVFEKQKLLKGEDVATLLESTVELVEKHKLFERDIITGRIRSLPLANSNDKILDQATAKNIFKTFFCDKLYIHRVTDTGSTFKAISAEQQDVIFQRTLELCTYNSRAELYKSIPKWDGTPRIQTFLRDYFKCDANWHFFLLFLTYVVGVMDNPETTIIEHWFDFVGESKGCLAGDVKINVYVKRGDGYCQRKVRIARLFDMAKNESDTYKVRSFNEDTKEMGYSDAEVIYSGEKQCYLLTTEDGLSIECSGNHRFYTDEGWKNILKLQPGDEIYANAKCATNIRGRDYRSPAADAKEICVKYHPVVKRDERKGIHRVREYKLIWEANANNMSPEEYIYLLNHYDGRPLTVVPKGFDVHHKNGNHFDNSIENLEILSKSEHGKIHGKTRKPKQYFARKVKIKSITPTKIKKTYDLSCVVGSHNYVANEFITHNTGKTTFFKHLLSGVGCEANAFECSADKRNLDDFWAELYARNTIIAIDDECKMLEKISYDTWKAVVTARNDTFSQKFCPPETHARPFVFVRTSNHPKTVYSLNERRQIIFNIGLREQECLHWDLDKNYMAQLLAEAKDYYVKHNGIYKLTQAEREEILEQNLDNTSTETPEYNLVEKYVEYLTENPSEYMENLVSVPDENYNWTSWNKFVDWAKEQKHNIGTMKFGAVFWKNLEVYARKHKGLIWLKNDMRKRKITKSTVRVFGIAKSPEQVDTEELPDLPF